jgi:hypothetical protein
MVPAPLCGRNEKSEQPSTTPGSMQGTA